jgi:hypothetical protein
LLAFSCNPQPYFFGQKSFKTLCLQVKAKPEVNQSQPLYSPFAGL